MPSAARCSSTGGARGYVQGGDPAAQAASVWVLIGQLAVYFCQGFRRRRGFGGTTPVPWALPVKYVVERRSDEVRNIAVKPRRRPKRAVHGVHSTLSSEGAPALGQRPPPRWEPLLWGV